MDKEKVIKAWECCNPFNRKCNECPYEKDCYHDGISRHMVADAVAMLKKQEVKTGYWIDSAGNNKCSICGEEYSDLYPDYGNTHFCPNCGAKMKGR